VTTRRGGGPGVPEAVQRQKRPLDHPAGSFNTRRLTGQSRLLPKQVSVGGGHCLCRPQAEEDKGNVWHGGKSRYRMLNYAEVVRRSGENEGKGRKNTSGKF
jgi:hypothetical protein